MTMRGTCSCGQVLWFDTVEQMVKLSKELEKDKTTRNEYIRYINETRPNGVLICNNCGKPYTEHEFSELKDCVGYGEHSQYTSDPELAYQQAVARAYDNLYRRDEKPTVFLDVVSMLGCLTILEGLLHYFTSFVRDPYNMSAVAIWDVLFILSVLGFFVSFIVLITDIGKVISGRTYRDC